MTPTEATSQPYMGLAEVAAYRGVKTQAASMWRKRGKLPEPLIQLKMGPVWRTEVIKHHFGVVDAAETREKLLRSKTQRWGVRQMYDGQEHWLREGYEASGFYLRVAGYPRASFLVRAEAETAMTEAEESWETHMRSHRDIPRGDFAVVETTGEDW